MNKDEIKKEYKEKIKIIKKYNESYYVNNKSIITDHKYDVLKQEIANLEKEYHYLDNKDSPTKTVGFKPSKNFHKVKHKIPMLSLGNAFNEEDLKNFEKKIINFLSLKDANSIEYSAEPKIDGISASLI